MYALLRYPVAFLPLLAGCTPDGHSQCAAALKACVSEVRRAASSLMSVYVRRKEAAATERVSAYIR
jgi:hypothetical protein